MAYDPRFGITPFNFPESAGPPQVPMPFSQAAGNAYNFITNPNTAAAAPMPTAPAAPAVASAAPGAVPLPSPRPPMAGPPPVGAPMSLAPPSPGPMAPPQGGQGQDPGLIARFVQAMRGAGGPQGQPQQTQSPMGMLPPWQQQQDGGGQSPSMGILPRLGRDIGQIGQGLGSFFGSGAPAFGSSLGASAGFGVGLG